MSKIETNKSFLKDLYEGNGPRLGLIYEPMTGPKGGALGDFTLSKKPIREWVPWYVKDFEIRARLGEDMDDDGVPFVNLNTNTGLFAAAFGCELHQYDGSNAAARPCVGNADEANNLNTPSIDYPTISRTLELGMLLQKELGKDVPISVPDIQSPFGTAAIIWNKEDFLYSLIEEPEAVKELTEKCNNLLKSYLKEFVNLFPNGNMCHCPYMWVPPEYGCHLSEDEIGIISPPMFEEFCLPSLVDLSETFGGLWMHCCADADQHYEAFKKIPNLRGLNRKFFRGAKACIEQFSDTALFSMGWTPEEVMNEMLDCSLPNSRFLFNLSGIQSPKIAKPLFDRLRARILTK